MSMNNNIFINRVYNALYVSTVVISTNTILKCGLFLNLVQQV